MSIIHTPRTVRNLANGYGLAQEAIRKSRVVALVVARILATLNKRDIDDEEEGDRFNADSVFVVEESGWVETYDYEWDREDAREHHKVYRATLKAIVEKANNLLWQYGDRIDAVNGGEVVNLDRLAQYLFGEDENIGATIRTEEAHAKAKKEERRKSLEATASAFAHECGHAVGTREFVKSAKERIAEVDYASERWNDGECQMERWATCMHSGSRDSYFDDNNYMNGKFAGEVSRLSDVLDYMRDAFPLLMLHIEREEVEANG
jgi:hypothetical protein